MEIYDFDWQFLLDSYLLRVYLKMAEEICDLLAKSPDLYDHKELHSCPRTASLYDHKESY